MVKRRHFCFLATLLLTLSTSLFMAQQLSAQGSEQELLTRGDRLAEDIERDASAKPIALLNLMLLQKDMTVLDFQAGTGYFAELLSKAVGPDGKVYAHNHQENGMLDPALLAQRYGNDRLPNVEQIFAPHNELSLPPESLDRVLMNMVYHDTYWYQEDVDWGPVDQEDFLARIRQAMKPGAPLLLVDHVGIAGQDPHEAAHQTHRIDPEIVRADFADAGFVLIQESDLLHNPEDDYSLSVFDDTVYRRTDRIVWLFRRH